MKIVVLIFLFFTSHCFSHYYEGVVEEVLSGIQQSLAFSLKNMIPELFKSSPMRLLLEKQTNYRLNENMPLNSTITINQVLLGLKNILPDQIPMIPFAIVEPLSNGILVFFGTLNSSFVNLTHFDSKVNMKSGSQSTASIAISLHINRSSLTGHYELDVSSYDMHLFGDGTYSVISEGTDATFNATVTTFDDDSFLMSDFSMNISLAKAEIFMTNFLGGDASSQALLDFIGEMIPQQIALLNDMLKETVNQTVTAFTNNVLVKAFSWSEIVWFIKLLFGS